MNKGDEVLQSSSYINTKDIYLCVKFLMEDTKSSQEIINKIEKIFDKDYDILLTTIHKAKGLEWDRVFVIEPSILKTRKVKKEWQRIEMVNLQYVMYSRALEELHIIPENNFTIYKKDTNSEIECDELDNYFMEKYYLKEAELEVEYE